MAVVSPAEDGIRAMEAGVTVTTESEAISGGVGCAIVKGLGKHWGKCLALECSLESYHGPK